MDQPQPTPYQPAPETQQAPTPAPVPQEKHGITSALLIIMSVLVLAGAYAGYAYWQGQWPFHGAPKPSSIDTTSWPVYRATGRTMTFEFRYPPDWKVDEPDPAYAGYLYFVVKDPRWGPDDTFFDGPPYFSISESSDPEYVGTSEQREGGFTVMSPIEFSEGGVWLSASCSLNEQLGQDICEAILSTFKVSTSAATTEWKTYTNTTYGFEFKYPASLSAQETLWERAHDETLDNLPRDWFVVDLKEAGKTVIWVYLNNRVGSSGEEGTTIVTENREYNGIKVAKYKETFVASGETRKVTYVFEHGGDEFEIGTTTSETIAEQILSTFRVAGPNASTTPDTAEWNTYTNTQYGFEVKYPANVGATATNGNSVSFSLPVPDAPGNPWIFLGITVRTRQQYNDPNQQRGTLLGEKGDYVATWNGPQECPTRDFCDANNGLVNEVLATFQFTK